MSRTTFDDDCPGCRPVIMSMTTGKMEPDDSPVMRAIDRVWAGTTLEERRAFHAISCLNSRAPADLRLMHGLSVRIQYALEHALDGGAS